MNSKMLSRRTFLKGVAMTAAGAALAACAAPVPGAEPEVVFKDVQILRWHHRLGGWEIYDERIKAFEEANPGVKVNEEEFPAGSAEYGPKIVSMVAAGVVGDVTWTAIGSGSYQFLVQNNGLAPLDDLIEADTSGFTLDEYYPRIISSLRMGDNRLYGLPELAHGVNTNIFFNRDLIEAEGLEAPTNEWTHDDLVQMAQALTTADRFGFLPAIGDYSNTRNQTLPYGGEVISDDGTTSLLNSEESKQGLRWVHDMFYGNKVAPTPQQMQGADGGTNQMFLAGQLAAYQSGGWGLSIKNVVEDKFVWDTVLMPTGPAGVRGGHLHVDAEAVTEQSEMKDAAYEFIKYLTDKEGGVGIALEIGLAARPDVYEDERVVSVPYLVLLGQGTEESDEHINPANLRKQELQTTVKALLDPLWVGDEQPTDEFFASASDALQEFLDKSAE
ncbi:MAG: sugar ABC transporter substrate-binding protein [Caldilineaceae bacterium]|nr:sugar ABC transporter substrate-binding protein [Caldilineaceae bacterium]